MVRTIAVLFALLVASVAHAQVLVVRTLEKRCTPTGCRKFTGTGACAYIGNIDNRSVYLTAAHVVNNASVINIGYDGQWLAGRVVHKQHSDRLDYAIVETQQISAARCFNLTSYQPTDGTDAIAYGYSNGIYNLRSLKAKIRVNRNGRYFSKMVAHGDSGGPILAGGQVAGIISAIAPTQGTTIYTDSALIRVELLRIYGRMPSCGGSSVAAGSPPQKPDPPVPKADQSQEIEALQGEVSKLREQLDRLSKTEIPVQIIGSDNKVLSEQRYSLGKPIKLRFKAVKK